MLKITINNKEYDFVMPDDWTLGEANTVKKISGLRVGEIGEALGQFDAGAVIALIFVTMKRSDPRTTVEQVEAMPLVGVAETLAEAWGQLADEGTAELPKGSDSGNTLISETIPESSGTQH